MLSMTGSGFRANEDLEVTLHSDPIILGYPTAAADGSFAFTVRIPAGVPAGEHTVIVRGLESGVTAEAAITVLPVGSPSTGVSDLASTGVTVGTTLAVAGGALFIGLLALAFTRRRRAGATA
jgi:LPXTG-motif cell wall-anchored protein